MPSPSSGALVLDSQAFELLRKLIQARFGLVYTPETAYLLERRLAQRVTAHGLSSFLDYYLLLTESQPAAVRERELTEVFELLSTRETYFFRESYQLEELREVLLPQLYNHRPRGSTLFHRGRDHRVRPVRQLAGSHRRHGPLSPGPAHRCPRHLRSVLVSPDRRESPQPPLSTAHRPLAGQ